VIRFVAIEPCMRRRNNFHTFVTTLFDEYVWSPSLSGHRYHQEKPNAQLSDQYCRFIIREILGPNLGLETGVTYDMFRDFPQHFQENVGIYFKVGYFLSHLFKFVIQIHTAIRYYKSNAIKRASTNR
jgi:hypothetical protein